MSFAVPVLEMCLDVLYFHSCGIVGIMMVKIKLAHLCAVLLCLFILVFFVLFFLLYVECELRGLTRRREGAGLNTKRCGLYSSSTLNVCAKRKKKRHETNEAHFNDTACNCAYNVKQRKKKKILLSMPQNPAAPDYREPVSLTGARDHGR